MTALHPASDEAKVLNNKRLIASYLGQFGQRDIDAVLDMMADDATWWVNGRPGSDPDSGARTKAEMELLWRDLYERIDGGLEMGIISLIGEGDRVVAEARAHAVTRTGRTYQNGYIFLFTLRDGAIAEVREYTDLRRADEAFG